MDRHAAQVGAGRVEQTQDAEVAGERRGRPASYLSYWSQRERRRRAEVFQRRERGMSVRAIAAELGLDEHEVQAVVLSDRRRRTP